MTFVGQIRSANGNESAAADSEAKAEGARGTSGFLNLKPVPNGAQD